MLAGGKKKKSQKIRGDFFFFNEIKFYASKSFLPTMRSKWAASVISGSFTSVILKCSDAWSNMDFVTFSKMPALFASHCDNLPGNSCSFHQPFLHLPVHICAFIFL